MQKKILIVDNDEFYVEIISTTVKLFLRQNVVSANNTDEAWELIGKESPALLIVNIDMAGSSTIEFVERLQDEADTKKLPIMALSSDEGMKDRAMGIGCMSFLHKPFKTRDLEAEIVRLLQSS